MTRGLSGGEGSDVNQIGLCYLCSSTLTLSITNSIQLIFVNFSLSMFWWVFSCSFGYVSLSASDVSLCVNELKVCIHEFFLCGYWNNNGKTSTKMLMQPHILRRETSRFCPISGYSKDRSHLFFPYFQKSLINGDFFVKQLWYDWAQIQVSLPLPFFFPTFKISKYGELICYFNQDMLIIFQYIVSLLN